MSSISDTRQWPTSRGAHRDSVPQSARSLLLFDYWGGGDPCWHDRRTQPCKTAPTVAKAPRRLQYKVLLILLVLVALGAIWRWTPIRDFLDPQQLSSWIARFREHSLAPVITLTLYLVGGITMVPLTALLLMTALAFPLGEAIVYSVLGCAIGGWAGFALGQILGSQTVRKLAGSAVHRISRRLARRGILSVAAIRLLPVAPYTLVNLAIGASHVKTRDFLLGNLLGLLPGIVAINLFGAQLAMTLENPGYGTVLVLLALGVGAVGLLVILRRALPDELEGANQGKENTE